MGNTLKTHDYLSKEISLCLKGICALLILMHHLNQRTLVLAGTFVGEMFDLLGFLAVSVFFFYSGYGLMYSVNSKGEGYLGGFLKKRVLPIYVIYLFLTLLSCGATLLTGIKLTLTMVVNAVFLIDTLVTYGWYLQAIIIFYLVFYFAFVLFKQNSARLTVISAFVVGYMIALHINDAAPATYISSLSFLLGIFWSLNTEHIDKLLKNRKMIISLWCGLFSIFALLLLVSMFKSDKNIRWPLRMIVSPLFVTVLLPAVQLITQKCAGLINNRVTTLLGTISLEIYVCQGYFFDIFESGVLQIENRYVYIVMVAVCTVLMAIPLYHFDKYIYKVFRK